jgi:hypothetical protein
MMSGPDILREVEESIRAEKAAKFWKENGTIVLAVAAAAILGTAGQSFWMAHKRTQNEVSTSQFLDALKDKTPISALEKLSKEEKGSGSALAGLNGAAMAIDKKDWAAAITSYQNVANNKSVEKSYKDLATVQMVSLQLDHDPKATGAGLLKSLEPLIADKKSPWSSKAIFISSLVKSTKNNDLKGAQADLDTLSSMDNLPASFLEQVKALNEVYKVKMGSK